MNPSPTIELGPLHRLTSAELDALRPSSVLYLESGESNEEPAIVRFIASSATDGELDNCSNCGASVEFLVGDVIEDEVVDGMYRCEECWKGELTSPVAYGKAFATAIVIESRGSAQIRIS